jgi:hypothetical protein
MAKYIDPVRMRLERAAFRLQGRALVHFLHIGKTGGSAIKDALRGHRTGPGWGLFLHRHPTQLDHIPEGEKVFFAVRDPVSRFVSGFNSRLRQGQPKFFIPWSPEEKIAFERFKAPNELAEALSDEGRRAQAEEAMSAIGHVRASYWRWFRSEEYFHARLDDIMLIAFQERLSADFDILHGKLALPESVGLSKDKVRSHRTPEGLDKRLSEVGEANLRRWYERDFAFVELCRRVVAENPRLTDPAPEFGPKR